MATLDDRPGSETLGQILATYYKQRTDYEENMKAEALIMTALYIAQLVLYYTELKEKVKDRDRILDKELEFLDYLHARRIGSDAAELDKKDAVRGLGELSVNVCREAANYKTETIQDAESFRDMEQMFAECSCAGIPEGWGIHDHSLAAGIAATSAGTLMPTMAKRRAEDFNVHRIELIRTANIAVRSLFTAESVLGYYQQAVAIYQGLIDTFIGGFNSAGAGLGVALQRLSASSGGKGNTITSGESSPFSIRETTTSSNPFYGSIA